MTALLVLLMILGLAAGVALASWLKGDEHGWYVTLLGGGIGAVAWLLVMLCLTTAMTGSGAYAFIATGCFLASYFGVNLLRRQRTPRYSR